MNEHDRFYVPPFTGWVYKSHLTMFVWYREGIETDEHMTIEQMIKKKPNVAAKAITHLSGNVEI